MATPLSEVIQYLNFEGTIPIGDEHETLKVILQEFGSMSVTVVSDQNLNLLIEFSNDSINWDYSNSTSITENSRDTITTVILGKWCRLRLQNVSQFVANIRFSTYCQVIPSTIQSQIEATGNNYPIFNVNNLSGTLYNDTRVSKRKPIEQHNFTYTTDNGVGILAGPDRELFQASGGGLVIAVAPATIVNNVLTLSNIFTQGAGAWQCVYGPPVIVNSGNPVYIEFSASYAVNGYIDSAVLGVDQMLVGMGYVDISTGNIIDGFYVGYPSFPNPPATIVNELSFVIFTSGVEQHIVQSKWSFDRLDGFGPSGVLLDSTKLSTWRIRTAVVNSVYLEYHNPRDNEWIPCHRVQFENLFNGTEIENPSYGFNVYNRRTSTATGNFLLPNSAGPQSAQGIVGIEVGEKALGSIETYNLFSLGVAIPVLAQTEILSIRAGPLMNGKTNRSLIVPREIDILTVGGAPSFAIITIYKNGTFTAPVWVPKDSVYEPTEISSGSYDIGSGYNIVGDILATGSSTSIDLSSVNGTLSRLESLTFVITSFVATTGVISLNYSLVN